MVEIEELEFRQFEKNFGEEERKALWYFLEYTTIPRVEVSGGDITVQMELGAACDILLTFEDASGYPAEADGHEHFMWVNGCGRRDSVQGGSVFFLKGEWEEDSGEMVSFELVFEGLRVEYRSYNATENIYLSLRPWEYLTDICRSILAKVEYSARLLNRQERELLGLMREMTAADTHFTVGVMEHTRVKFTTLREWCGDFGFTELADILSRLEKTDVKDKKSYEKLMLSFTGLMDEQRFRPLWNRIYGKLLASQQAYPSEADCYVDSREQALVREWIQKELERLGYSGSYPDFCKEGQISGIHVVRQQGRRRLLSGGNTAHFRIRCVEASDRSRRRLCVRFVGGLTMGEEEAGTEDIFDCMFGHKGEGFLQDILWMPEYLSVNEGIAVRGNGDFDEADCGTLRAKVDAFAGLIVHRIELRRLTREERVLIPRKESWLVWSGMGIFFMSLFLSVCLFLGFNLVTFVVLWISGKAGVYPAFFLGAPWWKIFPGCVIGIGAFVAGWSTVISVRDRRLGTG